MAQPLLKTPRFLCDLGTPADMSRLADHGYGPPHQPKVNSHIHLPPNFSAFESVEQAAGLAAQQGIRVLGVSNYYDFSVYADFIRRAQRLGIFPLFGLEIICLLDDLVRTGVRVNDPGNPGKFYFCGKGITRFTEMTPRANEILGTIRRNDSERMAEMIRRLGQVIKERGVSINLSEADVVEGIVRRHGCPKESVTLQERHVSQAYQEAIADSIGADAFGRILAGLTAEQCEDPVKVQDEIRSQLMKAGRPAFVEETFITFEEAYTLVLELGGIPCYPTLADGANPICEYETPVEKLIALTKERNIYFAEYIPIRNRPKALEHYVKSMRSAGLVVIAGTEHNTMDLIPIEPTCVHGEPVPDEIRDIFWEGTCVVAAHQFLSAHGESGFVDTEGNPNRDFRTDEERISAFRKIGAAVIQRYFESTPDAYTDEAREEEEQL